jgi:hypothetical protein
MIRRQGQRPASPGRNVQSAKGIWRSLPKKDPAELIEKRILRNLSKKNFVELIEKRILRNFSKKNLAELIENKSCGAYSEAEERECLHW